MTKLEICNRALALLGHDRSITNYDSDTSTEAVRCRLFYPTARDKCLAGYPWEWATKSTALAARTSVTLPTALVRIVDVKDASGAPVHVARTENTVKADAAATLRYIANDVTESSWPAAFTEAVIYELAYQLFTPLLGNPSSKDDVDARTSYADTAAAKLELAKEIEIEEHEFLGAPKDADALVYLDIANRALAMCGSAKSVRDYAEDPGPEAVRCRQLLPMALKRVIASHPWEFATKTVTATASPYATPTDFITLVSVTDADGNAVPATLADGKIVFSASSVTIAYTSSGVGIAKANPLFVDAVVANLAALLIPSYLSAPSGDSQTAANVQALAKLITDNAASTITQAIASEVESHAWAASPTDPDAVSRTDIANKALALVGTTETIRNLDTDRSSAAVRCRQMFNAAVRDVLTHHDWDFATVDKHFSATACDPSGWVRFVQEEDCVKIIEVVDLHGKPIKYRRDRDFISARSFGGPMRLRYVSNDIDLTTAPHEFVESVVAQLAYLVCNPLASDANKTAQLYDIARRRLAEAELKETDDTQYGGNPVNPFISSRR